MRTTSKKLTLSLASMFYILMSGFPLYAEDIEIFTGLDPSSISARPNILFIIDTSGSMSGHVPLDKHVYNPATTYAGTCDPTRYYWGTTGSLPDCSTTKQYISISQLKCDDASSALGTSGSGYYNARLARYVNAATDDYWAPLADNTTEDVECAADFGKHGDGVDTSNLYPASQSNNGPWRVNSTNAIAWGSTGGAYTIYTANYINYRNAAGTATHHMSRLQVVQHVLNNVIDSTPNINAALMRFDNKSRSANVGGYFVEPMQEIDSSTRTGFKQSVDALTTGGWTPLAETLYEALLYFQGKPVYFGNMTDPATNDPGVLKPSLPSEYQSPIEFQCQKNFVVVLTDGDPTYDDSADGLISQLKNFNTITGGCSYNSGDDCLDEVAQFLYETDLSPMQGDQNVTTYTIGFGGGIGNTKLLKNAARKGGSTGGNVDPNIGFFEADSVTNLTDAFSAIITKIKDINTTFVSPAVSVNAFNRLAHRDELYFALFLPTEKYRWPGNLKKYKLARKISGDPNSELIIIDDVTANQSAVDPATGFFRKEAKSFWSSVVDGPDVRKGGAAENLPTTGRRVYTFTGADSTITPPQTSAISLNNTNYLLDESNPVLVATGGSEDLNANALLGLASTASDAERTSLIQWARGLDVLDENSDGSFTDYRQSMGDPLHSEPQLVNYKGTETSPDITIFMATNEGYLHAIDADTGEEIFSFVPKELLPNLNILKNNSATSTRIYGLDGPMTVWHKDLNNDLMVLNADGTTQTGEHVYLYYGMRRGGKVYYAMDVTQRTTPKLKWKIEGGIAGTDFEELGQTWSKMTHAKIRYGGADKDVLIFGGGYDTNIDSVTDPAPDSVGRAIFIVDADTGQRLWWASIAGSGADLELADMKNSIAADLTVFDSNGDGYADRIYAADLAARIWRFDIAKDPANNSTLASLMSGGVIADLNGTALNDPTPANNRHFYYAPDVAYIREGSQEYLTIAIGSGYRAHPLDTVIKDRFYVIRDTNVRDPAKDANGIPIYTAITENDLYNTTSNIIGEGTQTQIDAARASLNTSNGWFIELNEPDGSFIGEKIISKSVTFNGILIFSSFTPVDQAIASTSCVGNGISSAWAINLLNGQPVFNFDTTNNDLTRSDRKGVLNLQGLPPSPTILFPGDGGGVTTFFGTVQMKGDLMSPNYFSSDYWNIK